MCPKSNHQKTIITTTTELTLATAPVEMEITKFLPRVRVKTRHDEREKRRSRRKIGMAMVVVM